MNNELQIKISNIDKLNDINDLNNLLKKCVLLYEMEAVVYIFDYIKQHKYALNDTTYKLINTLHSKTIQENSTLNIPNNQKKKLQTRRRIHKIMKGYNYSQALKNKDIIINYLNNYEYEYNGKDKKQECILFNLLKKECKLPISDIKHIITFLKK